MNREGHIYKLYCNGIEDFYIGSCWEMKWRIYDHKNKYVNPNNVGHNFKVYQYIRVNKGFRV